jgi:hypothetical protein
MGDVSAASPNDAVLQPELTMLLVFISHSARPAEKKPHGNVKETGALLRSVSYRPARNNAVGRW